jgi:hypothetical protein
MKECQHIVLSKRRCKIVLRTGLSARVSDVVRSISPRARRNAAPLESWNGGSQSDGTAPPNKNSSSRVFSGGGLTSSSSCANSNSARQCSRNLPPKECGMVRWPQAIRTSFPKSFTWSTQQLSPSPLSSIYFQIASRTRLEVER